MGGIVGDVVEFVGVRFEVVHLDDGAGGLEEAEVVGLESTATAHFLVGLPGGAAVEIPGGAVGKVGGGVEDEFVALGADGTDGVEVVVPVAFTIKP